MIDDLPSARRKLTRQHFHERRFARAVGADDCPLLVALYLPIQSFEQHAPMKAYRDVAQGYEWYGVRHVYADFFQFSGRSERADAPALHIWEARVCFGSFLFFARSPF